MAEIMKTPLVIIDMQDGYTYHFSKEQLFRLLTNIKQEIRKAKRRGAPIVVIQDGWKYAGNVLSIITSAIGKYPFQIVIKDSDNGAEKTINVLNRISFRKIRACGIFTSACVAGFVREILDQIPITVEIVADACEDVGVEMHNRQISRWHNDSSIRVI